MGREKRQGKEEREKRRGEERRGGRKGEGMTDLLVYKGDGVAFQLGCEYL